MPPPILGPKAIFPMDKLSRPGLSGGCEPTIKGRTMKRILLAGFAMMLGVAGAAAADVGGAYTVQGTNFDGSPYSGEVQITVTSNSTCAITWTTNSTSSKGFCMLKDNAFAAAYVLGNDVGLIIYNVGDDGTLDGIWTIAGKNGAVTEVLTPK